MSKAKTPQERIAAAQKELNILRRKYDSLEKRKNTDIFYEEKKRKLNGRYARAKQAIELAELEIKNPPPAPKTIITDNSKVFAPQTSVNVNSGNKTEKSYQASFSVNNNNQKPKPNKKSKKKTKRNIKNYFLIAAFVILLIGVIVVTVKITNCVNDNKNAATGTYSSMDI